MKFGEQMKSKDCGPRALSEGAKEARYCGTEVIRLEVYIPVTAYVWLGTRPTGLTFVTFVNNSKHPKKFLGWATAVFSTNRKP